jgi:hypothetical protein
MANILETVTNLLKSSIEGDPPPPAILQTIGPRLGELTAVSVDPSGDGIDRWLATLHSITNDTRLHDTLVVRAIQMRFPRLAESLTLLGIIGVEWGGTSPAAFSIDRQKLDNLLSTPGDTVLTQLLGKVTNLDDVKALQVLVLMLIASPKALLALEYRQQGFLGLPLGGVPGVNSNELVQLINELVNSPIGLPLPLNLPLTFDQFKAMAKPDAIGGHGSLILEGPDVLTFDGLNDLALVVDLTDAENAKSMSVSLGDGWTLRFDSSDSGGHDYRIQFDADGLDAAVPLPRGDLSISLGKQPADANALLLGDSNGTHFAIKSLRLGLHFRSSGPLFDVLLKIEQIEFALKPDFLQFLSFGLDIPTSLRFDSNVDVAYTQGQGLTGQFSEGVPGLSLRFAEPINLKIGGAGAGLTVDQVVTQLDLRLDGGQLHFRALFRYGASAHFGPLGAIVDGAGAWVGRWTDGNGGLLPPQGIGLSLDAGPVSGGGFLNMVSDHEFAGALQLKVLGIGAFAYGLYKTLPSGDASIVALIGIRLPPPGVQVGFGFAISGFGGLVGINRRADTDRVRERLASGAAGEVLFNDNPMQNAPKLLGDLQVFFPDEQGIFLIGPTLQINWLYILKLDAGVFIELPGPRKIFIAGSARLVIGSEEFALVYLRMDFIGGIDLTKSLIFFDAVLVNSHVLGIFRITGGVALRLAYGDNGYFLFTVGGFHPSFNPGAMELPRVARVGVSVSLGLVWLKQEMYLAITSNSFQLGSRVEAGIEIGPIAAHGWFGFDALIQFQPFYFIARVDAGFDVEVADVSLCSVRVEGQLSGPGPLVLQARASVRLLFIKVSGNVTIELSSNPPETIIAIPNLPEHLRKELNDPDNLRMEGEDQSVVFGQSTLGGAKLFAPIGELIWEQKRAPLNLAIEKVQGVELGGWHTLVATSGLPDQSPEDDWFGVGTYLKLGDAEALNTSRFVKQESGLRIGAGASNEGAHADAAIKLNLVKLPKRNKSLMDGKLYIGLALSSVLSERSHGALLIAGAPIVKVNQEAWNTHDKNGLTQNATPQNGVQAFVQAKQLGGIALPATVKLLDLTGVV